MCSGQPIPDSKLDRTSAIRHWTVGTEDFTLNQFIQDGCVQLSPRTCSSHD